MQGQTTSEYNNQCVVYAQTRESSVSPLWLAAECCYYLSLIASIQAHSCRGDTLDFACGLICCMHKLYDVTELIVGAKGDCSGREWMVEEEVEIAKG